MDQIAEDAKQDHTTTDTSRQLPLGGDSSSTTAKTSASSSFKVYRVPAAELLSDGATDDSRAANRKTVNRRTSNHCVVRWSRRSKEVVSCSLSATPAISRPKSAGHHIQLSQSQLKAGKAIIKKYRKLARNFEYKRLHSVIPAIAKRKYASKMRILREAIRYIDTLHHQLVVRQSNDATGITSSDAIGSSHLQRSREDAISLIQKALQPGIEEKLQEKRKFDQLAEQKLWEAATSQKHEIEAAAVEQEANDATAAATTDGGAATGDK